MRSVIQKLFMSCLSDQSYKCLHKWRIIFFKVKERFNHLWVYSIKWQKQVSLSVRRSWVKFVVELHRPANTAACHGMPAEEPRELCALSLRTLQYYRWSIFGHFLDSESYSETSYRQLKMESGFTARSDVSMVSVSMWASIMHGVVTHTAQTFTHVL